MPKPPKPPKPKNKVEVAASGVAAIGGVQAGGVVGIGIPAGIAGVATIGKEVMQCRHQLLRLSQVGEWRHQ